MKRELIMLAVVVLVGITSPKLTFAENTMNETVVMQEEVSYSEIKADQLPAEISESIQNSFPDATISQAFLGNDGTYKAIITTENNSLVIFLDAKGKIVKTEKAKA